MVEQFRNLQRRDSLPDVFLEIARDAYDIFLFSFDSDKNQTWPTALLDKISNNKNHDPEMDVPTPYEVMYTLKQNGAKLLPHLLHMREHIITQVGDKVGLKLLELHSAPA